MVWCGNIPCVNIPWVWGVGWYSMVWNGKRVWEGWKEQNKPLLVTILLLPRVTTITHIICYSVIIDDGDSDFDIFSCPSSSRPTLVTG